MSSLIGSSGYSGLAGPSGKMGNKVPSGYKLGQIQQYTPQQMDLHQRGFEYAAPNSYLSRLAGGDQSLFGEIEAPALKQFGALQGQLASRFSGMGLGARRGSGHNIAQNSAASDFALQLQSQRQGLQRQAIQDLQGLSSELLGQRPYEQFLSPKHKKQSGWGGGIGAALGGLGGFFAGGPPSALSGAQLGYGVGSQF